MSAPGISSTPSIRAPRGPLPPDHRPQDHRPQDHRPQDHRPQDDVRALVDRLTDAAPAPRVTAALRLAALVADAPDRLAPVDAARLDAVLPRLLRDAPGSDTPALVALVAALGARLSPAVCPPLQTVVRHAQAPLAVAAHVAALLVEGLVPSAQHLADLTAVADANPEVLAASRGRPAPARAAALAYALAVPAAEDSALAC
jgi:hypothetical protein